MSFPYIGKVSISLFATATKFITRYSCSRVTGKHQDVGVALVKSLQNTKYSVDEKLEESFINLFSRKPNLLSNAQSDGKDTYESREEIRMIEPLEEYQSGEAIKGDGSAEESNAEDSDSSESESSDKNEAAHKDASDQDANLKDHLKEHVEFHGGRSRRKVIFGNDLDHNDMEVNRAKLIISVE